MQNASQCSRLPVLVNGWPGPQPGRVGLELLQLQRAPRLVISLPSPSKYFLPSAADSPIQPVCGCLAVGETVVLLHPLCLCKAFQ